MNQSKPQSTLKQSTKVCDCGNTVLVLLTSLNKKYCIDCQKYIDWYLAKGQKSLLTSVIGGPSTHIIQDPTPIVESLPAGTRMKTETLLIPLNNVTELEIRTFCELFSQFHKAHIPEEFINQVLTHTEMVPNIHLEITHRPLSIGLTIPEGTKPTMTIGLCIEVYHMIHTLPDHMFTPEPKTVVRTDTLTVKEAALEYQELCKTFIEVAGRLGIQPIVGGRVANVKNLLQVMEQNFKRPTVH